jgi:NtrZ
VLKARALMIAGAVIATAGVAHAQDSTPAELSAARAETPWYQRFTYSNGLASDGAATLNDSDRLAPPAWTLSQKWGVTIDVREAQRVVRGPEGVRPDQAAVGAYYQFTPGVRLGGEVSLGAPERATGATPPGERDQHEQAAGVRIESAFRF